MSTVARERARAEAMIGWGKGNAGGSGHVFTHLTTGFATLDIATGLVVAVLQ